VGRRQLRPRQVLSRRVGRQAPPLRRGNRRVDGGREREVLGQPAGVGNSSPTSAPASGELVNTRTPTRTDF
jgi:hypothetical protein